MITLGFDFETSTLPFIHPWQQEAFAVNLAIVNEAGKSRVWWFNHDEVEDIDQQKNIREIQNVINKADRIVGQNVKFDLNWFRKLGINFDHCKLFCTQVAEFIITGQKTRKLSLTDLSKKYLKVDKIDRVKPFWDAGWQTSEIPKAILEPYVIQDAINALAIFQRQTPIIVQQDQANLIKVEMESTRILSDIECTGMKFNVEVATAAAHAMREDLDVIDLQLIYAFDFDINLGSKQELSVALFGGILKREGKEYFPRVLKKYLTAKDMCPLEYKSKKCVMRSKLPGIGFIPAKGSQNKQKGYYSVDKTQISGLVSKNKKQRLIKKLLIERSSLAQALSSLAGKYADDDKGLINKVQSDGRIHSQYNQTVAKTGRLSSKDPKHHWGL